MTITILPLQRRHVAGFREVLDGVARERRYLAMVEAPSPARVRRFVLANQREGNPQFVAVDEALGARVVGWCDVRAKSHASQRHSGVLGMGLAASHRGQGIGGRLLQVTIEAAAARGLARIELVVRTDNSPAIALYRRHGFETEGTCRDYLRIDGAAHDALLMARVR